jgi:hypothetical protein
MSMLPTLSWRRNCAKHDKQLCNMPHCKVVPGCELIPTVFVSMHLMLEMLLRS